MGKSFRITLRRFYACHTIYICTSLSMNQSAPHLISSQQLAHPHSINTNREQKRKAIQGRQVNLALTNSLATLPILSLRHNFTPPIHPLPQRPPARAATPGLTPSPGMKSQHLPAHSHLSSLDIIFTPGVSIPCKPTPILNVLSPAASRGGSGGVGEVIVRIRVGSV